MVLVCALNVMSVIFVISEMTSYMCILSVCIVSTVIWYPCDDILHVLVVL